MKAFFQKNLLTTSLISALIILLVGIGIGWLAHPSTVSPIKVLRENNPDNKFTNPLLLVDNASTTDATEYKPLEKSVNAYIQTAIANKSATNVSFYFRALNTGRWTGINEDAQFDPASLGKVAVLLAYLRQAESNSSLLTDKIHVTSTNFTPQTQQYYKPANPVVLGQTYSPQELIEKMIVDSDNNALFLLGEEMGVNAIKKEYQELHLPVDDTGNITYITPKLYSLFFRLLYNSTYISHELSEQTLLLLSQTYFNNGLVAGVPSGTVVSHKFGEKAEIDTSTGQKLLELHDCGIVYYPGNPYFICVMTKGTDYPSLEGVIKNISNIAWSDMVSFKK